jgi:hypothetical protein
MATLKRKDNMTEKLPESTPHLIDEYMRLEESIIRQMNMELLEGDSNPEELNEVERNVQLEILKERQETIYNQLSQKADTTFQWKLHTEAKASAIGEEIKRLQKTKKAYENAVSGLMSYLAFKMETSKIPEIPGEYRKMVIQSRNSVTVKDIELTSDHYLDLNEDEKEQLVKRDYSWDKNAVKRAYKVNPEMYGKYVETSVKKSVVFKKV